MMTRHMITIALGIATLAALGVAQPAAADVRLPYGSFFDFPNVHPGPPIYWRPMPEIFSGTGAGRPGVGGPDLLPATGMCGRIQPVEFL